ncbi:MAG: galactose oxidase early set domain-containing protein [Geodermatophilaceae bacterium]
MTGADGRVLFVAGFDENGIKTNVTESFDYRTNTHVRVPSLQNLPNYVHLHVASNSKFFVGNSTKPGFWDPYANTFSPGQRLHRAQAQPVDVGLLLRRRCPRSEPDDARRRLAGHEHHPDHRPRRADPDVPARSVSARPEGLRRVRQPAGRHAVRGQRRERQRDRRRQHGGGDPDRCQCGLDAGEPVALWRAPALSLAAVPARQRAGDQHDLQSQGEARNNSVLIYTPPYLFHGTRPVITAAPVEVAYGGTYAVNATATGATVDRFTLTTPSSPTHSLDSNQRYLSLPVTAGTITVPTSSAILPPGWYRLWAVDSLGRPSVAKWIHLS